MINHTNEATRFEKNLITLKYKNEESYFKPQTKQKYITFIFKALQFY